jgi:RNA polymerase sigma-70 factor (ECF subfamily)
MEEERIVQVYQECVHPLYGYVARRCGSDRTLAEDVTQETWLRAVAAWSREGLPENPLAWLKTVGRNLILNYFRRSPALSLEALPGDWEARYLGSEPREDPGDQAAAVSWGLARMRPAQARLIEAFHLDGLSVREIAEEMKISERAVEGRLRRARLSLRKKLEPLLEIQGTLK